MIVDGRLIRHLESSAATTALDLVDALNALAAGGSAEGQPKLGGALVAMGRGRYVNRAIGVTLDILDDEALQEIETYFGARGLAAQLELSSWAPSETTAALARRGYVPLWFRSVFATPVISDVPHRTTISVREVGTDDAAVWVQTYVDGSTADGMPIGGRTDDAARATAEEFGRAMLGAANTRALLASIDGTVAGCAAVQLVGDVSWLGAATTLPTFRGQGVQAALVAHRLRLARRLGCGVGAATAVPSSTSARNLLRLGFQPTHTQVVVEHR